MAFSSNSNLNKDDEAIISLFSRNHRGNTLDLSDRDLNETNIHLLILFLNQHSEIVNINLIDSNISDVAAMALANHPVFSTRSLIGFSLPPVPPPSMKQLNEIKNIVKPHLQSSPHLDQIVTEYLDENSVSYGFSYAKQVANEQLNLLRAKGFYVFIHGMGLKPAFYQDLLASIENSNMIFQDISEKRQYSFRVIGTGDELPATSKEFVAYFDQKVDDSTQPFRSGLLSTSMNLNENASAESANYFFSDAFSTWLQPAIEEFEKKIGQEIVSSCLTNKTDEHNTMLNKIHSARQQATKDIKNAGRLCLIAVPKEVIESADTNFAYRSHAFGIPCKQFTITPAGLNVGSDGQAAECKCSTDNGGFKEHPVQARLITKALRLFDKVIEVYAYDSLNASQRRDWENVVNRTSNAVKNSMAGKS